MIRRISIENPLWGAPRIHGELLKLGFEVAQATVAKYMVKRYGPASQGWRSGDLWLLGTHRLLCGDARDKAAYDQLWFNRWSELKAAQKITCKLLKTLVADAVPSRTRLHSQISC